MPRPMTLSAEPNGMTARTSIGSGMNGPPMTMPWRICSGVVAGLVISSASDSFVLVSESEVIDPA
jgi:hypothetical protein